MTQLLTASFFSHSQFNLEIDDTNAIRESLQTWRAIDLFSSSSSKTSTSRPPPLYLETYLDAADLLPNQSLVILDSRGRRWDALEGLYSEYPHLKPGDKKIVLERWKIDLQQQQHPPRLRDDEKELSSVLPALYKKCVTVFRALYSFTRYMPAYSYVRKTGKGKRTPITATSTSAGLRLRWRVREGSQPSSPSSPGPMYEDLCPNLIAPLYRNSHGRGGAGTAGYGYHHYGYGDTARSPTADDEEPATSTFDFGSTDSPAGSLSISVTYRTNCDFRVDDSEALLSSRFMGVDDDVDIVADETDALFKPTLQTSTARQVRGGFGGAGDDYQNHDDDEDDRGMDRIARAERNIVSSSPRLPPSAITPRPQIEGRAVTTTATPSAPKIYNRDRTDSLSNTRRLLDQDKGSPNQLRRPSLSFPVFKTPTLSSSPKRVSQLSNATTPSPSNNNLSTTPTTAQGPGATSRPASRGSTLFYQHTTTPSSESAKAREIPHHLKRASTTTAAISAGRPLTPSISLSSRRGTVSRSGSSNEPGVSPSLHGLAQHYPASGGININTNAGIGGAAGGGGGTAGMGTSPSTSAGSSRPKYSSSFSHRRSRLSLGGLSNPSAAALAEDNNSSNGPLSRRASLASIQQGQSPIIGVPGVGEAGRYSPSPSSLYQGAGYPNYGYDIPAFAASLGSIHADEENISDFLKLLESSKDLMKSGMGQSAILGGGSGGRSGTGAGKAGNIPGSGAGDGTTFCSQRGDQPSTTHSVAAPQNQFSGNTVRGTTISALSRFQRLRESNQQLSDSMSNSFLLQQQQQQQRPITASPSSSLRQQHTQSQGSQSYQISPMTSPPNSAAVSAAAAATMPIGAMSISPHTPAVPSRLSAASNVDYGDEVGGVSSGGNNRIVTTSGMVVPPPMTTPETEGDIGNATQVLASTIAATTAPMTSTGITAIAPVEKQEACDIHAAIVANSNTTETPATAATANVTPIDIPSSSPQRSLLSGVNANRRPMSAAPKPHGRTANEDEVDEFLPFVKTLSLGSEDIAGRDPPSVGDLLRGRPGVRGATSLEVNTIDSSLARAADIGPSSPRFTSGQDGVNHVVDVGPLPTTSPFSTPNPSITSTISPITASATARRSAFLPPRPTFQRPQPIKGSSAWHLGMQKQGSIGSLDEDEPLLFAMSDVGASRRSLEAREREKENRTGEKGEGAGADVEMAEQMELEN